MSGPGVLASKHDGPSDVVPENITVHFLDKIHTNRKN